MSEWRELKTLQEVAAAQAAGEEIQTLPLPSREWEKWGGGIWKDQWVYRSRPAKKTKTVKFLCWSDGVGLHWVNEDLPHPVAWNRVPDLDETVEVDL